MASFPSIFISHGPPTLLLDPAPARDFLSGLGETLGRPDTIVCVSAHWNTEIPVISTSENPETIYDFYNFPQPLYEATYPAPGAPDLARRTANLLQKDGLDVDLDADRGLDHGAWVPLKLMYPDADIPITQLSMQWPQSPGHHLAVGRALRPLREEGVLVLASGNVTHNLGDAIGAYRAGQADDPPPDWARDFAAWLADGIENGAVDDLLDYRARAPGAADANPEDDHLMPLYVALGAGDESGKGRRIHQSYIFRSLSMDAFAFGE